QSVTRLVSSSSSPRPDRVGHRSGRHVHSFSFSPDGNVIAYTRGNGRSGPAYRSDVFAVRLSDGVLTRLTYDGHSASPHWGPEWIVYERFRWGGGIGTFGRLWLMRPDGSGKR
ncbi:MAG: PD40 domain-containing protein, partial [Actinobacteria bacterium]|nr:PD40 domain-containing protein [Actinomycetota bacterium]